jgi:nucleoside phosphorylase
VTDLSDLLVVAATARELAPADGWRTLVCGVGPVEAAAATAAAIASRRPRAIVHVGIAGARRASGLIPPALVIGTASSYCDLRAAAAWAPVALDAPAAFVAAAQRALPAAVGRRIGTSAAVGGTAGMDGIDVEAMEGFAVLRAAAMAGVPAIEVRAISNAIEEPDRSRWAFEEAFAAITAATPALVAAIAGAIERETAGAEASGSAWRAPGQTERLA